MHACSTGQQAGGCATAARPCPRHPPAPVGAKAMDQGSALLSSSGDQLMTMRTIMSREDSDSSGLSTSDSVPAVAESRAARSASTAAGWSAAAAAASAAGLRASPPASEAATVAASSVGAGAALANRLLAPVGAACCRCRCCCAAATAGRRRRATAGQALLLVLAPGRCAAKGAALGRQLARHRAILGARGGRGVRQGGKGTGAGSQGTCRRQCGLAVAPRAPASDVRDELVAQAPCSGAEHL